MEENEKPGRKVWNSTLRRNKPLKGRTPLKRQCFARTKGPKYKGMHAPAPPKRRGLKAVSKKRQKALRKYFLSQADFLKLPENRFCWICIGRSIQANRLEIFRIMTLPHEESVHLLREAGAKCTPSQEVHHYAGRIGRLLGFAPYFVPECRGCREWPHVCGRQARELDLVASGAAFNVFPQEAESLWDEYEKSSSFKSKKSVD